MVSMRYIRGGRGDPPSVPPYHSNKDGGNKWSRESGSGRSNTASSYSSGRSFPNSFPNSFRGGGRSSHSFIRRSSPSNQLNGGDSSQRGIARGNGNKKWARKTEELTDGVSPGLISSQASGSGEAPSSESVTNDDADLIKSTKVEVEVDDKKFEKRGTNKLVMKRNTSQSLKPNENPFTQTVTISRNASEFTAEDEHPRESTADASSNFQNNRFLPNSSTQFGSSLKWKRQSSNISEASSIDEMAKDSDENDKPTVPNEVSTAPLENNASSALSFERKPKKTSVPIGSSHKWTRQSSDLSGANANAEASSSSKAKKPEQSSEYSMPSRKRNMSNRFGSSLPAGPRRISLVKPLTGTSQAVTEENTDGESKMPNIPEDPNETKPESPPSKSEKTLTDFHYRDTGRGGAGARGRGPGRGGRGNMGLVRVKPQNPSSTPICPTFRRGIPCNNPRCSLRHDVSTEASRPICMFFQRNGMCGKGESCPFRHVKVRWDAEVCPVFTKLGYCENPDCMLRHVVLKKPRKENSTVSSNS